MTYFTPEEFQPSEQTLHLIRQIAYTFQAAKVNRRNDNLCIN